LICAKSLSKCQLTCLPVCPRPFFFDRRFDCYVKAYPSVHK